MIRPRPRLPFRSTMAAAWPRAPPRSPTRPSLCGRGRSGGSGATRSRSGGRRRRTWSRPTTAGARSPGPRPRRPSTSSRTACSRSACARATPSRSSRSTRLEWALFDFALALVGAVGAAIYANSSPHDCVYVIEHSDAVGVLAEDEAQRAKLEGVEVEHVLTFADLEALRERGRAFAAEHPDALAQAEAAVGEDDLFTFIYTSGTTGPPKACMITHRNYYAMAAIIDALDNFVGEGDTMLLYLPLAHNFGRLMHLSAPYAGYTVAFLPDPLRTRRGAAGRPPDGAAERAARVREGARGRRRRSSTDQTGLRRRIVDWALAVGRDVSERKAAGRPIPSRARRAAPARRPARLLEGEGTAGRPAAHRDLRRRAAREGDRGVLPRARHPHPRGLRPDRVHDRRDRQPRRPLPFRHRRPGAARRRAPDRRRRRGADPDRDDLRGLLQGRGGDARGAAGRRVAALRRRGDDRRGRLPRRSPTARRTSSSPPAARTSRRRTSRTPSRPRSTSRTRSSSATGVRSSRRSSPSTTRPSQQTAATRRSSSRGSSTTSTARSRASSRSSASRSCRATSPPTRARSRRR